jgi:O-antigen ligase
MPLLVVLMMGGLFWSRGLLSISLILFIAISIFFYGWESWKNFKSSPWLIALTILFFIPLITWGWSEDSNQWWRNVQSKLPLLLLPFCTAAFMKIPKPIYRKLLLVLVVFSFMASVFSYLEFFTGNYLVDDYLKAKVMPVPMGNDHVRFAWLLLVVYIFLIDELAMNFKLLVAPFKWVLLLTIVYFAIYFHVLAAKTGLLGFYLVSLIALLKYGSKKILLPAGIALLCIPLLAWALIPSFRNRMKFVVWDYQNYSQGNYREGLSDAPRILSLQAGAAIVRQYPLTGTGAGDLLHDTEQWYAEHADYLLAYERLLPSNEILCYACAAGVFAGLAALCIFVYPFLMKTYRRHFIWIAFHAIALMGFMYEIGLEVQYGVFIYGFFGTWIYSRIRLEMQ